MNDEKNLQKSAKVTFSTVDTGGESEDNKPKPSSNDTREKLRLAKEAKLAEALRANLRKRKTQKKQRDEEKA